MPSWIHQTLSALSPQIARDAKGAPLSVRMASGNPCARKSVRKACMTASVSIAGNARHASSLRLK
jgi:hypothetical protein